MCCIFARHCVVIVGIHAVQKINKTRVGGGDVALCKRATSSAPNAKCRLSLNSIYSHFCFCLVSSLRSDSPVLPCFTAKQIVYICRARARDGWIDRCRETVDSLTRRFPLIARWLIQGDDRIAKETRRITASRIFHLVSSSALYCPCNRSFTRYQLCVTRSLMIWSPTC